MRIFLFLCVALPFALADVSLTDILQPSQPTPEPAQVNHNYLITERIAEIELSFHYCGIYLSISKIA